MTSSLKQHTLVFVLTCSTLLSCKNNDGLPWPLYTGFSGRVSSLNGLISTNMLL